MKKLDAKSVKNVVGGGKTCGRWNQSAKYFDQEERYCSPADKHGRYTGGTGWMEYRYS